MEICVLSIGRYLLGAAEGDVRMPFLLLLRVLSCKQVMDLNLMKTQELDTATRSHAVTVCVMSEHNYLLCFDVCCSTQFALCSSECCCTCGTELFVSVDSDTLLCQMGDIRSRYG